MPSRGHAMRETSGPGSAEAMDVLDSIYPSDVQRVGLANAVPNNNGQTSDENGNLSTDGPGGLISVPEDQQLTHAQIIASNAAQETSRRASPSIEDRVDRLNMMGSNSRQSSSSSVPMTALANRASPMISKQSMDNNADIDVFGPNAEVKAPTKRSTSSSSSPSPANTKGGSNNTIVTSQIDGSKPLPGLPAILSTGLLAENPSLPQNDNGQQGQIDFNKAIAALQNGPSSLPPQHIPRPIKTPSMSSSTDDYAASAGLSTSTSTAHHIRLDNYSSPISKDVASSTTRRGSASPQESGYTLAASNRSSIDDIRRLHAQRLAKNQQQNAQDAAAMSSYQNSQLQARNGGGSMQRPMSVIESSSRHPPIANLGASPSTAATGSSSRDAAFHRRKSTDGFKSNSRSGLTPSNSGPDQKDGDRESRDRDRERERERDRERDKERERRSRRTLGDYALGKTLGAGSMGKVKLGVKMGNGEKVAIKIIPRHTSLAAAQHPRSSQNGEKQVPPTASFLAKAAAKDHSKEIRTIREGSLQLLLHHPYVCGMREMMIHPNHYYMIFEYVNGGQMLDYIISHGKLRERAARKFARQIGSALEYCHRNSIVHRDLKIENILISKTGNIKIIDFGLSNLFSPHSHLSTFCGSLYFAAPELLNAKAYIGPEVDVWSFGIVLYVLVCGKVPFDDQSMPALHAKIKKGQVEYPAWLSGECKHILSRMLVTNPHQRATLTEILSHPWIVKGYDGPPDAHLTDRKPLRPQTLDSEVIKGMTGFEFGTPEDIESRLLEILTGDAYQTTLSAWEGKNNSQFQNLSPGLSGQQSGSNSADAFGFSSLGRAGTRSSVDSKQKTGSKRFSGIDFYRKKISTTSLFGSKDDSTASNALGNGNVNGNAVNGGHWSSQERELLDPTRGFHPLISIYYLVSEKIEREKLYGHSFFASSNASLPGISGGDSSANITGSSSRPRSQLLDGAGGISSMPTAADIPQEALQIPEVSHVASASRREGPIPSLPSVPAASARISQGPKSPTPIFESREKSQPLPVMAGPPRPRAQGDEVEAALREKGYPTVPATTPQWKSSSDRKTGLPALPSNNYDRAVSDSSDGNAGIVSPVATSQKYSAAPPPLEKDGLLTPPPAEVGRRNSPSPDKRRSFHALLTPSLGSNGAGKNDGTPGQNTSLVRRLSSMIGRTPSNSSSEMETKEKKRANRMSAGNINSSTNTPQGKRVNTSTLGGVDEDHIDNKEQSPIKARESQDVNLKSNADKTESLPSKGAFEMVKASTMQGLSLDNSLGKSTGQQLSPLGNTPRRPISMAKGSITTEETNATLAANNRQRGSLGSGQNEAKREGSNNNLKKTAQRSATLNFGTRVKDTTFTTSAYDSSNTGERDRDVSSSSKPIFLKGLFSVQTTTTKPRATLHADLLRTFDRIGLQYRELKGGYECVHLPSLDFGNVGSINEGRGNARITPADEMDNMMESTSVGNDHQIMTEGSNLTMTRPKKKGSRLSFISTGRKDRAKRSEASQNDGSSIGSFNNGSAQMGDESNKLKSRSRTSSFTTNTRDEINLIDQSLQKGATPSKLPSPSLSPKATPASIAANSIKGSNHQMRSATPTFVQSPVQSPTIGGQITPSSLLSPSNSGNPMQQRELSTDANNNNTANNNVAMSAFAEELAVRFEIYVVKVPLLLGVNGLQFRRISGNPWQYQQLARRVLQELKL